jgi:hypothetical protein
MLNFQRFATFGNVPLADVTIITLTSQLLKYCASHPDATNVLTASDMILAVKSDVSSLSVIKGRSPYFMIHISSSFLNDKATRAPSQQYKYDR